MTTKKQYEQPALVVYGSVEEMTQSKSPVPTFLDANYPQGSRGNIFS